MHVTGPSPNIRQHYVKSLKANAMSEKMWLPLESNPEVMETYLSSLGVAEGSFQVSDIYGL